MISNDFTSINTIFDKVYVITCSNFVDRQMYITEHFKNHNIDFEFRSSINKALFTQMTCVTDSELSLLLGHLHCIIDARLNKFNQILICEDDVEFCPDFTKKVAEFVTKVPTDWEFLQLGNHYLSTHWLRRDIVDQNVYRFKWGTGSHCIAIRNIAYDATIEALNRITCAADIAYYSLFDHHKCYCPSQFFADAISKNDHLGHFDKKYRFETTILHSCEK